MVFHQIYLDVLLHELTPSKHCYAAFLDIIYDTNTTGYIHV